MVYLQTNCLRTTHTYISSQSEIQPTKWKRVCPNNACLTPNCRRDQRLDLSTLRPPSSSSSSAPSLSSTLIGSLWIQKYREKQQQISPNIYIFRESNFPTQGLVLNGQPNLKLFNQLYWVITAAIVAVVHAIFPLPQLISGTFPAGSRYYSFTRS